mmetsp:Transcript_23297/g.56208  ORF Transcript_23297/g.56208 Transcript_23297/m.56208 type:complete len:261 (+) Transcript_23297:1836-2618(+)
MARSSLTTRVDSGRYSSYSPMLFIRSLFWRASCSLSLVLAAVSSARSAALLAFFAAGYFFPLLLSAAATVPSTFRLTAAPAPVRCPVTNSPMASTPTPCTRSRSAMVSPVLRHSALFSKYACASRTISMASAPAYSSCSVRGEVELSAALCDGLFSSDDFVMDALMFAPWTSLPCPPLSTSLFIPGGRTPPRPCRSAWTATSLQASRAPQNSRSTAGSQSPTVSNFSRASLRTLDVSVRFEEVWARRADVSEAGDVNESR